MNDVLGTVFVIPYMCNPATNHFSPVWERDHSAREAMAEGRLSNANLYICRCVSHNPPNIGAKGSQGP
jgi:hypothetical protein